MYAAYNAIQLNTFMNDVGARAAEHAAFFSHTAQQIEPT